MPVHTREHLSGMWRVCLQEHLSTPNLEHWLHRVGGDLWGKAALSRPPAYLPLGKPPSAPPAWTLSPIHSELPQCEMKTESDSNFLLVTKPTSHAEPIGGPGTQPSPQGPRLAFKIVFWLNCSLMFKTLIIFT